ncbi:MAG: hypothetical protein K8963_03960, partial [Proteobacteria bacterium]|nr:hypothetical protein [Pseudomonadota bacterium]
ALTEPTDTTLTLPLTLSPDAGDTAPEAAEVYAVALTTATAPTNAMALRDDPNAIRGDLPLPAGSATISGLALTLTGLTPETEYNIYYIATDPTGNLTEIKGPLTATTLRRPPSLVTPNPATITVGQTIAATTPTTANPLTITNTNTNELNADTDTPAGCAIDSSGSRPSLPQGLSITRTTNKNNCEIIGTATQATDGATEYTIVASTTGGSDTTTLTLTVNDVPTHASVTIANASPALDHPAGQGLATTLFDDTTTTNYALYTYEDTATTNKNSNTAGQVTATIEAADQGESRGMVITYTTGTETTTATGLSTTATDLNTYTNGLLQFDIKVTTAPTDASATWTVALAPNPTTNTAPTPTAQAGLAGQSAFPLNTWRTVRVDLSQAPWQGTSLSNPGLIQIQPT